MCTPRTAAISPAFRPSSVSRIARARSASSRCSDFDRSRKAARSAASAVSVDLPGMLASTALIPGKQSRLLSASGVMEACGGGFRYDDGFRRSAVAGEHGGPVIMATVDPVNLASLLDDTKCFALVRQHRWPEGVRCPGCGSDAVVRNGHDDTQPHRQRYRCQACASRFDDLSGTVLAGHHQPLRIWVLCLYFMGLNLSNRQIAAELGVGISDVQLMTEQLRNGLVAKAPEVSLSGNVEVDEVYVVDGHKGQPAAVAKRGGRADAAGWRVRRDGAHWRRTSRRSSV